MSEVTPAEELLAMIGEDDETRARLARDGSLFHGYHPEMERVHRRNAARLRELVGLYGWPGRDKVGVEASRAAWRILQHAIGEPAFMRSMLPLVEREADPVEAAMLIDRIRVFEGKKQLFGTQYDWDDGGEKLVLTNGVEEGYEERREQRGMKPLQPELPPPLDEPPPKDPEQRKKEAEAWALRVGWR